MARRGFPMNASDFTSTEPTPYTAFIAICGLRGGNVVGLITSPEHVAEVQ
jgi:hypothetical protein